MGTRGLVGLTIGKKRKSTYNHYDSYPSNLGENMVEFCKTVTDWDAFKANAKKVELVDEHIKVPTKLVNKYIQFSNVDVGDQELNSWYCLLRKIQGVGILEQIRLGNVEHMINSNDFIKDSLFCEYAYIINLDTMKLEMYKGFQKGRNGKYKPCKKVGEFPVTDIPEDWAKIAFPKD